MSAEGAELYSFFGWLLAALAAATFVFFLVVVRKKIKLRSWLAAAATVVESEEYDVGGKWRARFAYEYEVGGRGYKSRRVFFYRKVASFYAQELVARHPAGSSMRIFYDPERPAEAVVDKRLPALWILLLAAVACAACAAYLFTLPARLGH